jgi:peptidoglycan hydrolase-like protein with peptidoglycan-binding domain
LTQQGFDTDGIDGKIGPKTINAVRDVQLSKGARPDGYASFGLLKNYGKADMLIRILVRFFWGSWCAQLYNSDLKMYN